MKLVLQIAAGVLLAEIARLILTYMLLTALSPRF